MLVVGGAVAVVLMVSGAQPAAAACHHFMVSASPNPVAEGETLTVTVSRDANLAPSHVDVSTIDETATAGMDYPALSRTVSFTTDIQQSFPLSIPSHPATSEPARTFRLHLGNPGGCAVNPNFVVDPDVQVTIEANGVVPTTAATTPTTSAATTGPATGPTATTTAAPSGTGTLPHTGTESFALLVGAGLLTGTALLARRVAASRRP